MYTIEFESTIENDIIKIPPIHLGQLAGKVKVIIHQEQSEKTTNYIDELLESPLKVENFTPLSREEIYEARG
ncbi:MAG TPA: hypothetical protein ENG03_02950 [Thioploca sp.]|nr:MAG: hypothetical protein DRR19_02030 [Gammaproteobacteria bacterium]HDN26053.1 hypothetical protein [Thioploca sp.]